MNNLGKFLEVIPFLCFIITFYLKGMHYATIAIVFSSIFCLAGALLFRIKVPGIFWIVSAIIIIFGTISIVFKDPNYIKLKPTIVYLISATTIFVSALLKKPVLQKGMSKVLEIEDIKIWRKNSYFVSVFFVLCALLNEFVRKNFDDGTWLKFKIFGFTGIMLIFFAFFLFFNKKYLKSLK